MDNHTWTGLKVARNAYCQLPTGLAAMLGLGEDGPGDPLLPSTTGSRAAPLCLPAALLAVHWGQGLEGDRGGDTYGRWNGLYC